MVGTIPRRITELERLKKEEGSFLNIPMTPLRNPNHQRQKKKKQHFLPIGGKLEIHFIICLTEHMQFERSFVGMKVTPLGSMPASPMHHSFLLVNNQSHITHYSYMKRLSFCPERIFFLDQCPINSLISHNYSGHAFFSSYFLFSSTTFFPSRYTSASLLLLSNKAL